MPLPRNLRRPQLGERRGLFLRRHDDHELRDNFNDGTDPYYLVDHTAFTYLVLPEIGFVEFFNRDTSPVDMAERTACFIEAAR